LAAGFDALDLPMPVAPTRPTPDGDDPIEAHEWSIQFELFKADHKAFVEKHKHTRISRAACTPLFSDSVESHTRYPSVKAVRDGIELMKIDTLLSVRSTWIF
jgi:hypothetical protein